MKQKLKRRGAYPSRKARAERRLSSYVMLMARLIENHNPSFGRRKRMPRGVLPRAVAIYFPWIEVTRKSRRGVVHRYWERSKVPTLSRRRQGK